MNYEWNVAHVNYSSALIVWCPYLRIVCADRFCSFAVSLREFFWSLHLLSVFWKAQSVLIDKINNVVIPKMSFFFSAQAIHPLFRVPIAVSLYLTLQHLWSEAGIRNLTDSSHGGAAGWSSGRWHRPLCLSQCPWTEPCQEVAASSDVHSEPHPWAVCPAARPHHLSAGWLGRTVTEDVNINRAAWTEAAGAGHHHPSRALWHGPGWTGLWSPL